MGFVGWLLVGKLWSKQPNRLFICFIRARFRNDVIHYYEEFEFQKLMVLKRQGGTGWVIWSYQGSQAIYFCKSRAIQDKYFLIAQRAIWKWPNLTNHILIFEFYLAICSFVDLQAYLVCKLYHLSKYWNFDLNWY